MQRNIQLSTGLVFTTNDRYTYGSLGYATLLINNPDSEDPESMIMDREGSINGRIFINKTWTPVTNFNWKEKDVIASWEE